jgi:hypothetical protein
MKKQIFGFILAFIAAGFFLTQCQKTNQPLGQSDPELKKAPVDWSYLSYPLPLPTNAAGALLTVPLYAGKTTLVGNVTVIQSGANLLISYNLDACVTLVERHLSVTALYSQIPLNNGNPPPGQFNYNDWPGHFVGNDWVYDPIPIPYAGLVGNQVFIAAHAVVTGSCVGNCTTDCTALLSLPTTADAVIKPNPNSQTPGGSYFYVDITNGGILNGLNWPAWCADADVGINVPLTTKVKPVPTICISATDFATAMTGIMDVPANINKVNWILNQDFVGQASCAAGTDQFGSFYTRGDVQTAIWALLDPDANATHWMSDPARLKCILDLANQHGDFVPTCGQQVGIVLVPIDANGVPVAEQPVIISIPVPCQCGEPNTAWAIGLAFPGNNWAMYFNYLVLPPI